MTGRTLTPRARLALLGAAGWLVVSLLPWWETRVAFADAAGERTERFGADVWRASTPGAVAVVVAAAVTVALVLARGRRSWTPARRAGVLVAAWTPVALLGLVAWSVLLAAAEPVRVTLTVASVGEAPEPDHGVLRDHLDLIDLPGHAEGPAWGLYVAVPLVLAVAVWATLVATRSDPSPAPRPS